MSKSKAPDVPFLITTSTLGVLFAFDSALTLDKVSEHYRALLVGNRLADHIDVIAVLDRGMISVSAKVPQIGGGWRPCIFDDPNPRFTEGTHVALGAQELGDDTLDAFLRVVLAHLAHFRGIVDHPGFDWRAMRSGGETHLRYVTSLTEERDPEKARAKLKEYAEQVAHEFAASPVPKKR